MSEGKETMTEDQWDAANAKLGDEFAGFPGYGDFGTDPLEKESYVSAFTAQFFAPGAIPADKVQEAVAMNTQLFLKMAEKLSRTN
eukprot:g2952.t1